MKRKFLGVTRSSILLSSALLLAACGGSDSDGGGPAPNAAVGGIWEGTATIAGQTLGTVGLVAEDGRGYVLIEDGALYWGNVVSSGNQITAALTGAPERGLTFADGSRSGTGSISGTIQSRVSISANSSFTTALGSTTTGTVSLNFVPSYNDDSSLALIAGNYVDTLWYFGGVFNIASNGDIFFQDPGFFCVINGKVAIINPAYNAYDIRYTYSNCVTDFAFLNGVTFEGLATYDADFGEFIMFADGLEAGVPTWQAFLLERQ
jgi:hypothetical protein